jgi:hypothetical protein
MTEVSDLPTRLQDAGGLPGFEMLRRNVFGMALGKKPQRAGPANVARLDRSAKQQEITGGYAHA